EMAAGMKARVRNDWKPLEYKPFAGPGQGGPLADLRQKAEYFNPESEVSMRKVRSRSLPEQYGEGGGSLAPSRPPQGPNEKRAAQAVEKATEKVIGQVVIGHAKFPSCGH